MGAISIAFDTIIAGALALPWLLLVVHLFFPNGEQHVSDLPKWIKEINQPAAVAVVLFAATYLIGSAVSRTAQDFFNDDDLHLSVNDLQGHTGRGQAKGCPAVSNGNGQESAPRYLRLRVGMTENRVLASVYCEERELLSPKVESPTLSEKIKDFQSHGCACGKIARWHAHLSNDEAAEEDALNDDAGDIFGLEQSALLLRGEDATLRLRQLHDQVMVLRSAAFNGLIACAMCLFAWGARLRREKPRSLGRWLTALVPGLMLVVTAVTIAHHVAERDLAQPPYMEFSLLLVAGGGVWLLWLRPARPKDTEKEHRAPCRQWAAFTVFSILLTITASLAWWSSEVVYAREVVYSYDSLALGGAGK